jgi:hypothetical protein
MDCSGGRTIEARWPGVKVCDWRRIEGEKMVAPPGWHKLNLYSSVHSKPLQPEKPLHPD